ALPISSTRPMTDAGSRLGTGTLGAAPRRPLWSAPLSLHIHRHSMRNRLSSSSLALFLVAPLAAQQYVDDFSYPNGPGVPGWTQQRGNWQIQNGRMSVTSGATWAYITKDGLMAQDCVLDGEFFFVG